MQIKIILILIAFSTVIFSCNPLNKRNSVANEYYNQFSIITNSTVKPNEDFSKYFGVVGFKAKRHPNYNLEQSQIDSLSNLYDSLNFHFKNAIMKLEKLGEFDTFHLSKLIINKYKIINDSYASTIPVYLQVYKIGLKDANVIQLERMNNAPDILNQAVSNSTKDDEIWEKELYQFIKIYNIKY